MGDADHDVAAGSGDRADGADDVADLDDGADDDDGANLDDGADVSLVLNWSRVALASLFVVSEFSRRSEWTNGRVPFKFGYVTCFLCLFVACGVGVTCTW